MEAFNAFVRTVFCMSLKPPDDLSVLTSYLAADVCAKHSLRIGTATNNAASQELPTAENAAVPADPTVSSDSQHVHVPEPAPDGNPTKGRSRRAVRAPSSPQSNTSSDADTSLPSESSSSSASSKDLQPSKNARLLKSDLEDLSPTSDNEISNRLRIAINALDMDDADVQKKKKERKREKKARLAREAQRTSARKTRSRAMENVSSAPAQATPLPADVPSVVMEAPACVPSPRLLLALTLPTLPSSCPSTPLGEAVPSVLVETSVHVPSPRSSPALAPPIPSSHPSTPLTVDAPVAALLPSGLPNVPAWLNESLGFFRKQDFGNGWVSLIHSWLEFERSVTYGTNGFGSKVTSPINSLLQPLIH